jgi:hypothetical protein
MGIFYKSKRHKRRPNKVAAKPTDGRGTPVLVRLPDPDVRLLDAWISRQPDSHVCTRPEGLRRLMRAALLSELERVPA